MGQRCAIGPLYSHYLARFFFFFWYHLSTSYGRFDQHSHPQK